MRTKVGVGRWEQGQGGEMRGGDVEEESGGAGRRSMPLVHSTNNNKTPRPNPRLPTHASARHTGTSIRHNTHLTHPCTRQKPK